MIGFDYLIAAAVGGAIVWFFKDRIKGLITFIRGR